MLPSTPKFEYLEDIAPVAADSDHEVTIRDIPLRVLKTWPREDLAVLKARLDELMPSRSLKDVNLEYEAVAQLHAAKDLQHDVLADPDIPANQKSQVLNTTTSCIQNLVRAQVDLRRDETLKRMEAALIESLKLLPDDAKAKYFDEYEAMLNAQGVQ